MHLEKELSSLRAAISKGKVASSAEAQIYLPHLASILRQHMSQGGIDPCQPAKREDLLAEGVPLEQGGKQKCKRLLQSASTKDDDFEVRSSLVCPLSGGPGSKYPIQPDLIEQFVNENCITAMKGLSTFGNSLRRQHAADLFIRHRLSLKKQ